MSARTESRHRVGRGLIGLGGVAAGTLLLIWLVAVPMDPVCPAAAADRA